MASNATWFENNSGAINAGISAAGALVNAFRKQPAQPAPSDGTGALANVLNQQLQGFNNPFNYQRETNTISSTIMLAVGAVIAFFLFLKK